MWKQILAGVSLVFAGFIGWAVTLGGFSLDDPELEEARLWVADYKTANPEMARRIGPECGREIGRSPWTRDGAFALFTCIRRKAEGGAAQAAPGSVETWPTLNEDGNAA